MLLATPSPWGCAGFVTYTYNDLHLDCAALFPALAEQHTACGQERTAQKMLTNDGFTAISAHTALPIT